MEFPNVPMIEIVSPYVVSHTLENIQPQHVVIQGSPAVRERKVSNFFKNYLFNLNFPSLFLLRYTFEESRIMSGEIQKFEGLVSREARLISPIGGTLYGEEIGLE